MRMRGSCWKDADWCMNAVRGKQQGKLNKGKLNDKYEQQNDNKWPIYVNPVQRHLLLISSTPEANNNQKIISNNNYNKKKSLIKVKQNDMNMKQLVIQNWWWIWNIKSLIKGETKLLKQHETITYLYMCIYTWYFFTNNTEVSQSIDRFNMHMIPLHTVNARFFLNK